ncbi:probable splicing factor, arginine/serine-rich 5 [Hydra vulgaris]|uniref:Probable splicing factor, arginine/serine-rich 5 n=1 Tax=Hydra vulgaris TaxID=6087 RepID=A0ABM4CI77_HYDVU|nr:probable splicing factor, arginine/serine-rich 5 [Hydra vulgaris]
MSSELFVGNLNPEVRVRDLENCFGRYGKIVRCDLKKNFGFIQFEDRRDAEIAIQKENNRRLLGSDMTVEWARGTVGDKMRGNGPPPFRKPHSPDRFQGRGGPPFISRPRSPPVRGRDRSPILRGRDRSPGIRQAMGRGRERSPLGRSFQPFPPREGGRDDRFGGRRSFDNRENFNDSSKFSDRGPPTRGSNDRFPPRERFNRSERFPNDRPSNRGPPPGDRSFNRGPPLNERRGPMERGSRGPPPRINGFDDRRDRFPEKRDGFGERRNFGGGPRRF